MKMTSPAAVACVIVSVLAAGFIVSALVVAFSAAPAPTVHYLARHSGHFNLTRSHGARLFYFYFPATGGKGDEPLVIWLQGGPGSADEFGLFYLNGPVHLNDDMSLKWNEFSWNKVSNMLYIDQPVGTGFSSISNENDFCLDEDCVSNDLYNFLQDFLEKNPGLAKKDFYITGESFAGHYIPAFASRIHKGNKENKGIHINLKGFAIGNGCTNPEIQYGSYGDYAHQMGLINSTIYEKIRGHFLPECLHYRKQCLSDWGEFICMEATIRCGNLHAYILNASAANTFDVRKKCQSQKNCYNLPILDKFLNQPSVKHSLRAGNLNYSWQSVEVYYSLEFDKLKNLAVGIPALLEDNIRMLIYAGEYDLSCNWLGNSRWVRAMDWWGKHGYAKSTNVSFIVDGVEAGLLRSYGPVDFLKVYNAGHMVPMDQPSVALQIIKRWMDGKLGDI